MLKRLLRVAEGPRARRCKFVLDAPHAGAVAVAGSFNDWSPDVCPLKRGKDGAWQATLLLPPGRYEYRFVVDGQWRDDPACDERVPNGHGSENCVRRVRPATTGKALPADDVKRYRAALEGLGSSVRSGLAHDQGVLMRTDGQDAEGGTLPYTAGAWNGGTDEVETGVIANAERLLGEVTAALGRIDAGTFGWCEECGKRIAKAQLTAAPYARLCIRCARAGQAPAVIAARTAG